MEKRKKFSEKAASRATSYGYAISGKSRSKSSNSKTGSKNVGNESGKYAASSKASGKSASRAASRATGYGQLLAGKHVDRSSGGRSKRNASKNADEFDDYQENPNIIVGRNPVMEALKSGREVDKILVTAVEGSAVKIVGKAKDLGVPVIRVEKAALDRISGGKVHQGIAAYVSSYDYAELDDIFKLAEERGEKPFIVILDGLEDPHNLGAIMRTCECVGAHGVIIPKRRACGLTDVVAKTSAGAIEYIPCVKVTNLAQTVDELKERGVWVCACDMDGKSYYECDMDGSIAVVIGSEGFGISKLVKDKCDFVVSMPMKGKINSLNASNAAAVILYEVRRQRDTKGSN